MAAVERRRRSRELEKGQGAGRKPKRILGTTPFASSVLRKSKAEKKQDLQYPEWDQPQVQMLSTHPSQLENGIPEERIYDHIISDLRSEWRISS